VFIRVAVPVPQLDLLTYRVPASLGIPAVGARVIVPLGSRLVTGIVVELVADGEDAGVPETDARDVQRLLDDESFIPPEVVELSRWTAEYYAAGAGETITAVLPPKTRGTRADAHKTYRVVSITPDGAAAVKAAHSEGADSAATRRNRKVVRGKRLEALRVLATVATGLPSATLGPRGITSATIATLSRAGLISVREERLDRDPFETDRLVAPVDEVDRPLSDEQSHALTRLGALVAADRFEVALLHGVTGSGKTEVYLRLARVARARGRGVIMLVPEIALTPAIAAAFRGAFGNRVAIQHSGLSDGERHDQWQRTRRSEIDVVVGTRSAIFAPLSHPGLIIVDEEHDASYKQEESPRYNARDVAIVRAKKAGALVLLGSATPSMESYHHAMSGKYRHLVLERRVLERPLAAVTVVDMRDEYAADGPDVVLSRTLQAGIEARLRRSEQSLVLLNRRGFATAVFCRQCAGTIDCPNCSVSLVVHGEGRNRHARCHYCNLSRTVPSVCPACGAPYLEQAGFGTQRVEAEVRQRFPGARVARLDRDAVRRKGTLSLLLSRFREGAIDVLIGTQMIAKGHDFPGVTLVGVVSADASLGMADFRASERTFQLLTQVAGRAGRGEQAGEAIVQTLYPDHYSIQLACRQDYPAFYARELRFRQAMRYPPRTALINIIVRAPTLASAMRDAGEIAAAIDRCGDGNGLTVLGPAPAPLTRLRGQFRAQVLVKGSHRRRMREAVTAALAARPQLSRRSTVDVDPLSVL
jgi:primosomal protein N' (replication factor Y)